MCQLHRRFTDEQIEALLQGQGEGQLRRADEQESWGVGKPFFCVVLTTCRQGRRLVDLAGAGQQRAHSQKPRVGAGPKPSSGLLGEMIAKKAAATGGF